MSSAPINVSELQFEYVQQSLESMGETKGFSIIKPSKHTEEDERISEPYLRGTGFIKAVVDGVEKRQIIVPSIGFPPSLSIFPENLTPGGRLSANRTITFSDAYKDTDGQVINRISNVEFGLECHDINSRGGVSFRKKISITELYSNGTEKDSNVNESVTILNSFNSHCIYLPEGYNITMVKVFGEIRIYTHTGRNMNSRWRGIYPQREFRRIMSKYLNCDPEDINVDDPKELFFSKTCETSKYAYHFSCYHQTLITNSKMLEGSKETCLLYVGHSVAWETRPDWISEEIVGKEEDFIRANEFLGTLPKVDILNEHILPDLAVFLPASGSTKEGILLSRYGKHLKDVESGVNRYSSETNPYLLSGESMRIIFSSPPNTKGKYKSLELKYHKPGDLFQEGSIIVYGPGYVARSLARAGNENSTIVLYRMLSSPDMVEQMLMSKRLYREIYDKLDSGKWTELLPFYDTDTKLTLDMLFNDIGSDYEYVKFVFTVGMYIMPRHQQEEFLNKGLTPSVLATKLNDKLDMFQKSCQGKGRPFGKKSMQDFVKEGKKNNIRSYADAVRYLAKNGRFQAFYSVFMSGNEAY